LWDFQVFGDLFERDDKGFGVDAVAYALHCCRVLDEEPLPNPLLVGEGTRTNLLRESGVWLPLPSRGLRGWGVRSALSEMLLLWEK
jgi:hypothetical protein